MGKSENIGLNTLQKHDDYMTPKIAWENIQHYLPKDKIIWECFYGDYVPLQPPIFFVILFIIKV